MPDECRLAPICRSFTRGVHPAAAIYDTDRIFADLRGGEPGVPDGMKVDVEGNVYCSGAGGIRITDPNG